MTDKELENQILGLLAKRGPLTGAEILEAIGSDGLQLWRTCRLSTRFRLRTVGTRYLRLDRRLENYVRLSPSIFREFLSYTVVSRSEDLNLLEQKALGLGTHIEEVSRSKQELAYSSVCGLTDYLESETPLKEQACFILAGDIVYNMAHDVPRPERSTGRLVNGSDMDMIVVMGDSCPTHMVKRLDEAIFNEKMRLLTLPHIREEIDYVVKKFEVVREQAQFDTFKKMLACKILQEGAFLYGSEEIFSSIKELLKNRRIPERLAKLEQKAREFRNFSEQYLLTKELDKIREEDLQHFYPTEESEEFE